MTGCGCGCGRGTRSATARAWLWLARQSAPAFDRASAERDRLRAARDAVRLALPGRARAVRRARAGVLRELNAGRLAPAAAVAASGLMDRPGVPDAAPGRAGRRPRRHRRPHRPPPGAVRTEIASVRAALLAEIASVRDGAAYGDRRRTGHPPRTPVRRTCRRWTGPRWWPGWRTRSAMRSAAESGGHRTTTR